MSASATPVGAPPPLFYAIEDVCRRWDGQCENAAIVGMENWTLEDFFDRAFTGWQVQVCLWRNNRAGAVLRNPDGVLYAVPVYWPAKFLPDTLNIEMSPEDEDEWDEESSYRAYGQGDRESCFDPAVSDAVIAYARMDLIDLLLGDDEPGVTKFDGTFLSSDPNEAALLALEAVIVSADEPEGESLRVLSALRGVTQPTGYTRLA